MDRFISYIAATTLQPYKITLLSVHSPRLMVIIFATASQNLYLYNKQVLDIKAITHGKEPIILINN